MSFILDALKKSETERQQQGGAEFATVPAGTASPRTPRWIWVLAALLGINVAAMLGLLLRDDSPPEAATVNTAPNVAPTTVPPIDVEATTPEKPPVSFEDRVAEARDMQAEVTSSEPAQRSPAYAPSQTATVRTDVPSVIELRADGRLQIPELHLDIHVFSEVPAERFVFINMNKHTQGSVLDEGPRVVEITIDGVVLEYRGQSFKLTRE